ncbi:hypothetical protein GCM10028802_34860 [Terrabacter terrigena]
MTAVAMGAPSASASEAATVPSTRRVTVRERCVPAALVAPVALVALVASVSLVTR